MRHGLACLATSLGLGLLLAANAVQAAPRDGLPQRNLLVSWRVSGQGHSQMRQAGIEVGRIVIDSRRGVVSRGGVSVGAGMGSLSTDTQGNSEQQVLVLNGGRARIFVGRTQSVTAWQLVGNPSAQQSGSPTFGNGGVTVVPQTVWVDVGQGIHVTPRWTGGRDVVVEIEAQSRQPAQAYPSGAAYGGQLEPDGQTRHSEFFSTVGVPLNEWTVVARTGGSQQRSQAGSLSTRDVDETQSEQLEIRISVP